MNPQNAAAVDYDDEFEKANASLQVAWSAWMDENSHYKTSSFYKKVKCLMISWDKSCDDLHTEKEARYAPPEIQASHQQVLKHISDFLYEEDAYQTLLLVYYAGHGSPKPSGDGITLTGMRNHTDHPEELNEVVWGPIEDNFQHTKGDVLEIFDCCYAGDLGRTRQPWSTRSFEFLGACSSGNVTLSPGEESFTTALIWALGRLLDEQTRFTVSELSCKIRNAPGFPRDQVPVQLDRGVHAIQRIMLAPLPEPSNDAEQHTPEPPSREAQGLLNLNFFLDEPPTKPTIKKFAQALSRFMWQEKMPVNNIVWGGLTSWDGTQPSARVNAQKLAAAKMFQRALDRKNTRGKRPRRRSYQSGMRTPLSDV
ncbi:MAG: hypothetical protein Q9220_005049 [cf. Caloplaca sp. 1 TL-2023]